MPSAPTDTSYRQVSYTQGLGILYESVYLTSDKDAVWVSADPAAGGGDVGGSAQAVEAGGEVAQGGHDLWAM